MSDRRAVIEEVRATIRAEFHMDDVPTPKSFFADTERDIANAQEELVLHEIMSILDDLMEKAE